MEQRVAKSGKRSSKLVVVFNNSSVSGSTNEVGEETKNKREIKDINLDKLRENISVPNSDNEEDDEDMKIKNCFSSEEKIKKKTTPETQSDELDFLQDEIFGNKNNQYDKNDSKIMAVVEAPKKKPSLKSLKKYKNEKKEEIVEDEKRQQILDELDRIEKEEYSNDDYENEIEEEEDQSEELPIFGGIKSMMNLNDYKDVRVKEGYLIVSTNDQERAHKRFIIASKGEGKVLITVWNNDRGPKSYSPIHKLYTSQHVIQEKYPFKTSKKSLTIEKNMSFIHSLEIIPNKGGPKERLRLWSETERDAIEWELSIEAMLTFQKEPQELQPAPQEGKEEIEEQKDEKNIPTSTGRVGKLKGFFSKLIANNNDSKNNSTPKKRNFSFLKK
eukprot:gene3352-5899_t